MNGMSSIVNSAARSSRCRCRQFTPPGWQPGQHIWAASQLLTGPPHRAWIPKQHSTCLQSLKHGGSIAAQHQPQQHARGACCSISISSCSSTEQYIDRRSSNSSSHRSAVISKSLSNGTSSSTNGSRQQPIGSRQALHLQGRQQQQQQGWEEQQRMRYDQQQQQQQPKQYSYQQQSSQDNSPRGGRPRLLQQRQAFALQDSNFQAAEQDSYQQQGFPEFEGSFNAVDIEDGDGLIQPQQLLALRSGRQNITAWYSRPKYMDPQTLHAAILERCGRGEVPINALTHLVRTAACPRDAQLALSALSAVRAVSVGQGRTNPWNDKFARAFVKMTAMCEAHEVLLSAMQRPNELGFIFKWKTLLVPLKHWGDQHTAAAADKIQAIMLVAEDAGLRPDRRLLYVVVRACVNAGQFDRIDGVLAWFRDRGVTQYKPAMVSLLEKARQQQQAAAAEAEVLAGQEMLEP